MNLSPARNTNFYKSLYKSPTVNNTRAAGASLSHNGNGGGCNLNNAINNDKIESPSWREAYKKKCFDEFKKSRQKLMNKFRNFKV